MFKTVLLFILARIKEPSSMAGLSMLGVLFGVPPGLIDASVQVVVAIAGVAAVVLPEKPAPAPATTAAANFDGNG